jgi:hypothetical protein
MDIAAVFGLNIGWHLTSRLAATGMGIGMAAAADHEMDRA